MIAQRNCGLWSALRPSRKLLCGLALASCAFVALAGPEDDYKQGLTAYRADDVMNAMPLLKRAADAGHAGAQALLADILDKAELDEEAVAYYRKSADQGNADGEYGLGTMYASGEGVKRDPAQARLWITKAAEQGHKQATNVLAQAYIGGELGIGEDERKSSQALAWIKRAADNNYIPALDALAAAYRSGDYGLAVDTQQAEKIAASVRQLKGVRKNERAKKTSSQSSGDPAKK